MANEEFIDTYSDDLLYLIDSRKCLLTSPFRIESKDLCNASFCRLFAVFMVGSIEAMLEFWKSKDNFGVLSKYFDNNVSNEERIQNLYEAFRKAGVAVDREVFEDYLAIKYLRNIVVHARWKPYEKEQLEKRGFPTNTRRLSEEHWYKMLEVSQNMMIYIALTGIPQLTNRIKTDKLKVTIEKGELKPIIIRRKDFPEFIRRNLGMIASEIYDSIEKTATSEKYSWDKSLSSEEVNELSNENAKKLFYTAAKKASLEGDEEISKHRQIMNDALYFWYLYKQETFTKCGIQNEELDTSIQILMKFHNERNYPKGPFPWDRQLPRQVKLKMVSKCLKVHNKSSHLGQLLINALDIGESTYKFMDGTFVNLFAVYLPIIDSELAKTSINEIEFILKAWKLGRLWYFFVEKRLPPKISELLFYEMLFDTLINHNRAEIKG